MERNPAKSINMVFRRPHAFLALALLAGCSSGDEMEPEAAQPADIPIAGERVFPESITADAAGNLYVGSLTGTIYRASAGADEATPWAQIEQEPGPQSQFGVLADDAHGLLWTCVNPNQFNDPPGSGPSTLQAFSLETGDLAARYEFPEGEPTACNDIAVASDGTVYASETASGRIFTLSPNAESLELFAQEPALVGIDGLAFAEDGTLYINNVRDNLVQRVELDGDGDYAGISTLELDDTLSGPDGLRPLGGSRFIQAEGPGGRVAIIDISGDSATVTPVKTGLDSSPGVTVVDGIGYATEGKIGYLIDPELSDQDPGPFVIRAFELPQAE